jgi:hypothetical protein
VPKVDDVKEVMELFKLTVMKISRMIATLVQMYLMGHHPEWAIQVTTSRMVCPIVIGTIWRCTDFTCQM